MNNSVKYIMVFALVTCMMVPAVSGAILEDIKIVVIDKDGDPIEDAEVEIYNLTSGGANDVKVCDDTTNDDGEITCVEIDDSDNHRIEVSHSNYLNINNKKLMESNDLDDLDNEDEIAVVLRPKEISLDVTVVDSEGDDVADATLTIVSLDEDLDADDFDGYDLVILPNDNGESYDAFEVDESDEEVETNNRGEASFDNLEYNTAYRITIEKTGFPTYIEEFNLPDFDFDEDPETAELDLEIVKPGSATFTATVRDKDSNALIQGATVIVASKDANSKGI